MLNFIYGALAMWFVLGAIIYHCAEVFRTQNVLWKDWYMILIVLPFFIIALPIAIIIALSKKIKNSWEREWRWKLEEIKEKIKYRY